MQCGSRLHAAVAAAAPRAVSALALPRRLGAMLPSALARSTASTQPARFLVSGRRGGGSDGDDGVPLRPTGSPLPDSDDDVTDPMADVNPASMTRLLNQLATGGEDDWDPRALVMPRRKPLWMLFEDEQEFQETHPPPDVDAATTGENAAFIKVPMRDEKGRAYSTGRRKTSTARVWVKQGDGAFVVNGQELVDAFPRIHHRYQCLEPMLVTQSVGAFDVWLTVKGGGLSGQAGAARHGLAKALARYDPYLRAVLKRHDMLKRDPRMVERKKPGQKKARKKFQWVKR